MINLPESLLRTLAGKDADLAEHLRVAAELLGRPDGIHLKLAAHAVREFGLILPAALGIERKRGRDRLEVFKALAPQWRLLPAESEAGPLDESPYDSSIYTGSRAFDESTIPSDLYRQTREAFDLLVDEATFATAMVKMVRILDPLGDPITHAQVGPSVHHWLKLHNWFVNHCHAEDLAELEAKREEFHRNWRLYVATLQGMFEPAIDTLPVLLELASHSPIEPGVLDHAIALLKKAVTHQRFFLALKDDTWLRPLDEHGFFTDPYPAQHDGNITSFPSWPQAQFLVRVAPSAGRDVARIISRLAPITDNATVQADLLEAAVAMPPSVAASLVGVFAKWLESPASLRVPLVLGTLCVHLANGGQAKAALKLLRAALRFDAPPPDQEYLRSVRPRIDRFLYERLLRQSEVALDKSAGHELLALLCRQLRAVIAIESGNHPNDHSGIWMPSLTLTNEHSRGVKDALASSLLRVGLSLATRGPADCRQVIDRLRRERYLIFRRIELAVLAHGQCGDELGKEQLLDHARFIDDHVRQEYGLLLRHRWEALSREEQQQILGWIHSGPDQQWLIDRRTERDGAPPPEDLLRRHREGWQMARLQPIANLLSGEDRRLWEVLRERGVEPAPLPVSGVTTMIGPVSPLAPEELKKKRPAEVIAFLRDWMPSYDVMAPSPEGLGRNLTTVVTADPQTWSGVASEFQVGMHPTYVRSYLDGLMGSAGSPGVLQWSPVLGLCTWVVAQPPGSGIEDPRRDEDPDWNWTRKSIASLLQRGLRRELGLPFEHRQTVWGIIEALARDPDPFPEQASDRDAETITLNSVRGVTLHAAVEYALWCARNLQAQGRTPSVWMDEMPEVRAHFTMKLDQQREPSAAVPSVFAHYLPNLLFLDREWLEAQLPRLFGDLGPVWQVYLLYGQLHGATAPLLAPYYLRAATEARPATSDRMHERELQGRLPEHLLLLRAYLGTQIPQLENILAAFFRHAPVGQRAHLIGFAGLHIDEAKGVSPEARQRIMDLVEDRVRTVTQADDPAAKEELTEWAALCRPETFPDEWVLRIAKMAVRATPASHAEMWVGERMAKVAESNLAGAMEVLRIISAGDLGPLGLHSWADPAEKILALAIADESLRPEAIATINNFTERGYSQFEGLLPG